MTRFGKFATLLIVLALVTAAPGVWAMGAALAKTGNDGPQAAVPVWAYLTIFAAFVQLGYAVYLLQFPHWISLQAVALIALVSGILAALVFGGTLVGGAAGWAGTVLQLGDWLPQVRGPKVTSVSLWCLLLTVAWTGLAIWCGWQASIARRRLASADQGRR
jgi:hypothetical protein